MILATCWQADDAYATAAYLTMVVPVALYAQRHSPALLTQWVDTTMLMTRHPWEITGAALAGFLLMRFLEREPPPQDAGTCLSTSRILVKEAVEFCKSVETWLKENRPATALSEGRAAHRGGGATPSTQNRRPPIRLR